MRSDVLRQGICSAAVLVALLTVIAPPARGVQKHDIEAPGTPTEAAPLKALGSARCVNGFAAGHPCSNVDLLSFLPLADLGAGSPQELAADLWGWTDPETGREYALIGLRSRVSFVDITDPASPRLVGWLMGAATGVPNREVNVYANHAYIVADGGGANGIQIFNLTLLRELSGPPAQISPSGSMVGSGLTTIHNFSVNPATGFGYAVGGASVCHGGLHMFDLHEPLQPQDVGCWADPAHAYIHDVQCTLYHGPDRRFEGREICLASGEDALLIVDVTDKANPQKLSRTSYAGVGYSHQGWLTEDHKFFLMNDELDELSEETNTRTYIWDVSDLTAPRQFAVYEHPTRATDHNLYIHGKIAYEANYRAGLRLLDVSRVATGKLTEVGYFDIVPDSDAVGFDGAWGNYLFPSGSIAVSGIGQGLYVVKQAQPRIAACRPGADRLCFQGNRFQVDVGWKNPATGEVQAATVLKRGPNFGVFTLGTGQADLIVRLTGKGKDVRLAYGQLTNVPFSIHVTDNRGRTSNAFFNGVNECGGIQTIASKASTETLLGPGIPADLDLGFREAHEGEEGTCKPSPNRLCLHNRRFQVEVDSPSKARATALSGDSGSFAFKPANGVDLAVKAVEVEDEKVRIVWGSTTNAPFTFKVLDTLSGEERTYVNPAGTFCGGADPTGF
jgi:choice-of-anchor B domain-containing protein